MGCSWAAASGVQRAGAYCVATRTACLDLGKQPHELYFHYFVCLVNFRLSFLVFRPVSLALQFCVASNLGTSCRRAAAMPRPSTPRGCLSA